MSDTTLSRHIAPLRGEVRAALSYRDVLAETEIRAVFHEDRCATWQVLHHGIVIFDAIPSYGRACITEFNYAYGVAMGLYGL